MSTILNDEDRKFISKNEQMLQEIIKLIENTPLSMRADLKKMADNIDHLKNEIKYGKNDDLPGLFYSLNQQYALYDRFKTPSLLPSKYTPYFGHMKLLQDGIIKDILLGHISFLPKNSNLKIVDWCKAPISKIYYNYQEGENYELDLPNKSIEGKLLEKNILTIRNGILYRIDNSKKTFIKKGDVWQSPENESVSLSGGEGAAYREVKLGSGKTNTISPDISSLLDQKQFGILNKSPDSSLLIFGGAGSGKTTVILHRLAVLCKKNRIEQKKIIVLVPEIGLVRLSKKLLAQVGLYNIKVQTTSNWIKNQARNLIKGLPKRECNSTPFNVSFLKKHLCMVDLQKLFLEKKERDLISRFEKNSDLMYLKDKFLQLSNFPLLLKIENLKNTAKTQSATHSLLIEDFEKELMDLNNDRFDFFTDRELLNMAVGLSNGQITSRMVEDTVMHTARQFKETTKDADYNTYKDATVDGRDIDSGTIMEIAETIDIEDYSFLLNLLKLKNGAMSSKKSTIKSYKHIVLDEAQEIPPLEHFIYRESLDVDGAFSIAGDPAQQIDESINFYGWDRLLKFLSISNIETEELKISYRSPQSIVNFAQMVLGPLSPDEKPISKTQGKPVKMTTVQHNAHCSMLLNDVLLQLSEEEPNASIAILCSNLETSKMFYQELNNIENTRFVTDGEFSFTPGIDITTVDQVKGLEFDYVIIPDATNNNYPDRPISRRKLHLAATRAIHQLWVISNQERSYIIRDKF